MHLVQSRAVTQCMSHFASSHQIKEAVAQWARPWLKRNTAVITVCASVLLSQAGVAASHASAQDTPAPKVLTLFEQQALLAFNPGGRIYTSITLSGDAVWTAGSLHETGTVLLKVSSDGSTSETWTLPTQSHSYADTALRVGRTCSNTDPKGALHTTRDVNCLRSVPWFAPWMGAGLLQGSVVLGSDTSLAADLANGVKKLTFQTGFTSSGPAPAALKGEFTQLQTRAAVTVSYNQLTALPSTLTFSEVFDGDPAHTIQYQAVFSDFRVEGGCMFPHRIQRYIQRTLQADITITSAVVE